MFKLQRCRKVDRELLCMGFLLMFGVSFFLLTILAVTPKSNAGSFPLGRFGRWKGPDFSMLRRIQPVIQTDEFASIQNDQSQDVHSEADGVETVPPLSSQVETEAMEDHLSKEVVPAEASSAHAEPSSRNTAVMPGGREKRAAIRLWRNTDTASPSSRARRNKSLAGKRKSDRRKSKGIKTPVVDQWGTLQKA